MKVKIKLLDENAIMPTKQYVTDSGFDLYAAEEVEFVMRGNIRVVSCGFCMELPPGYEAQIRSRSGLAMKHGISVINSPGTIDQEYTGIIKVGLVSHKNTPYTIRVGDRIAQMVIKKVPEIELECVEELSDTSRGANGFGSTGR